MRYLFVVLSTSGKWGPGKGVPTDTERQEWAEKVMKDANVQAHIGPHNIAVPGEPSGHKHQSHDKHIKTTPTTASDRTKAWSTKYHLREGAKKNKNPQANHTIHDALDRLSSHLQGQMTGSRKSEKSPCRSLHWLSINPSAPTEGKEHEQVLSTVRRLPP